MQANSFKCLSNQDYTCIFDKPFVKSEKSLQNTRNERFNIISCIKSDEEPAFGEYYSKDITEIFAIFSLPMSEMFFHIIT